MRKSLATLVYALLSCVLLYGPMANAGMYKWVDENGEVHYGDSIPPRYADKERRKINEQGMTIKVYDAARTPEERAEAHRLEEARLAQEKRDADQARLDHVLLATYSSEDDMLKTRDGKLSAIEGLIQLTQRRITSMNKRMMRLTEDAADYERGGKSVPDILTRQIENIRKQTVENEIFIKQKQLEQDEINGQFQKEITRFRALQELQN